VFAAVRRADRKPRICMLRTVAGDEHAARRSSFAITSSRLPAVCWRRCAHETHHHYRP
jgi:hypothetical protein